MKMISSLIFLVTVIRFSAAADDGNNILAPADNFNPSAVIMNQALIMFEEKYPPACSGYPLCLINPSADSYANVLSFYKADACLNYLYVCAFVSDSGLSETSEINRAIAKSMPLSRTAARKWGSSTEIWGRKELQDTVTRCIEDTSSGHNLLIIGGTDVGKSTYSAAVAKNYTSRSDLKVLYIPMQHYYDSTRESVDAFIVRLILVGLKNGDKNTIAQTVKAKIESILGYVHSFAMKVGLSVIDDVVNLFKNSMAEMVVRQQLLTWNNTSESPKSTQEADVWSVLRDLVLVYSKPLTIFIDEAQILFAHISENDKKKFVKTINFLIKERHINLIMISSDSAFIDELKLMSFNKFPDVWVMEEVKPSDMYNLLTTKFDVKKSLAASFINLHGGHVSDIVKTLGKLSSSNVDTFSAFFTWQVKKNKKLLRTVLDHAIAQETYDELQMLMMLTCQGYVRFEPTPASIKAYEYLQSKKVVIVVDRSTTFSSKTYSNLFSTRTHLETVSTGMVVANQKSEVTTVVKTDICEQDDFESAVAIFQPPSTQFWFSWKKSEKILTDEDDDLGLLIAKQSSRIVLGSLLYRLANSSAVQNARKMLLQGNKDRGALLDRCFV